MPTALRLRTQQTTREAPAIVLEDGRRVEQSVLVSVVCGLLERSAVRDEW